MYFYLDFRDNYNIDNNEYCYKIIPTKSAYAINLDNIKNAKANPIMKCNVGRKNPSLVSTIKSLYVLGGLILDSENIEQNVSNSYRVESYILKSCEMYIKSGLWISICDLNEYHFLLTATFIYPSYIYVLGGKYSNKFEKLNTNINSKWQNIEVTKGLCSSFACTIQIKKDQLIFFGGKGESNSFIHLNLLNLNVSFSMNKTVNRYYCGTRVRLFDNKLHLLDIDNDNYQNQIISIPVENLFN